MAYNNRSRRSNRRGYNGSRRRKGNGGRKQTLTRLAYNMGQVKRGLENPDSMISSSFAKGASKPTKKNKKSLF